MLIWKWLTQVLFSQWYFGQCIRRDFNFLSPYPWHLYSGWTPKEMVGSLSHHSCSFNIFKSMTALSRKPITSINTDIRCKHPLMWIMSDLHMKWRVYTMNNKTPYTNIRTWSNGCMCEQEEDQTVQPQHCINSLCYRITGSHITTYVQFYNTLHCTYRNSHGKYFFSLM